MVPLVRRYRNDEADHTSVVDICANIYGGTDYIPRVIKDLADDPTVLPLVCGIPEADDGEHRMAGLVCGQKKSDVFFLFGLRVADFTRGKGLGTLLMQEVCDRHHEIGPCKHLVGVTTPHQPESMRIFQKLQFQLQRQVNCWPPFALLRQYEDAIGFPQADYSDAAVPSMLDWMPGVRMHLQQDGNAAELQQQWQCCTSLEQLQQAVAYIRQHQHQESSSSAAPWDWLPFVYDIQPCDCELVLEQLEKGNIWLLQGPSNGSITYQGVLMTCRSKQFRRQTAGILATNSSAVMSAIRWLGEQHKHFVTFIDLVDGDAQQPAHLELYDVTGGHGSFYVYHKPAGSTAGCTGN